jgi:beta-glucuronidase
MYCKQIFKILAVFLFYTAQAQPAMINVSGRHITSLNGNWNVLLDPVGDGEWKQVWLEKKPLKKTDFFEYSFDGTPLMKVPGDFNHQMCELANTEGVVWYKKEFNCVPKPGKRLFIHFSSVNYLADVYLNGEKLGSHEGGFTPFQFEITDKVKTGNNSLIVKANSHRVGNGLPGFSFDWFNYGGITGDVNLVETPETYIRDYSVQLKKGSANVVSGWVQLSNPLVQKNISIKIPELKVAYKTRTNDKGIAELNFTAKFTLWSPENPKLYKVFIESETDTLTDEIGFRTIEVQGTKVLLNGKPVFLKTVNIHAENPYKKSRACTKEDALTLLNAAKDLGCNLVRLAHYPHNETMVKEAEKMGMMVWCELPIYQHIQFADSLVPKKMERMLGEMVHRDRNRCAVVIWSLSNETYPGTPNRNEALISLTKKCRALDSARLIVHVANTQGYSNNSFTVHDTIYYYSDLVAINEYIGWYVPWQGKPGEVKWKLNCPDKPVFISEFGGEALYKSTGPEDEAAYWTEEYQAQVYQKQIKMFGTIPNLCGVCPWLLFDYRSPVRMHPVYQKGYNRKGLLSENGEKKKAWFIIKEYFN